MAIEKIDGWRGSDGVVYDTRREAELAQAKYDFFQWCEDNLCRGGEWSANMVADAIWEKWYVNLRGPEGA